MSRRDASGLLLADDQLWNSPDKAPPPIPNLAQSTPRYPPLAAYDPISYAKSPSRPQNHAVLRPRQHLSIVQKNIRGLVDLHVVVDGAVEPSKPIVDRLGHVLQVDHPDSPLTVNGDLQRLTQVLANVLGNAARYTPSGGVIRLRYAADDDRAVLRVQDTGIGIPADQPDAVFEMFSQVPKAGASSAAGGLGIGLTLSRRLIELHGGSIVAASAGLGQGSEFMINLPLVATNPVAESAKP